MSERYASCRSCRGSSRKLGDCFICGGTGFSGDVMDLLDPSYAYRSPRIQNPKKQQKTACTRDPMTSAIETVMFFNNQKRKRI